MIRTSSSAWLAPAISTTREYVEALVAIAALTVVGRFVHVNYRAFGHVYLLAVIVLSLRVGRGPVLVAAIVSGAAWSFVFIPPRFSFAVFDFEDSLVLGTYFAVALIAGQLTAQIRTQERNEHLRERRATALFQLTRALTGALTLEEAVEAALRQADDVFTAHTGLYFKDEHGVKKERLARSFPSSSRDLAIVEWVWKNQQKAGRFTKDFPQAEGLYLPLARAGEVLGVFLLVLPERSTLATRGQRELIDGFVAQIALLLEKEQFRAASDREKLLAESERLHRTLLDSVSHELKTPLAVLRAAAENLGKEEGVRRASLVTEITTATRRLDRLVANLLDQNRLESGALKAQMDWCDARDLIGSARRELGEALAGRPFKTQISPEMPLFLADAPLMEHVISNLLLNAALHTPAGLPLVVSAGIDELKDRIYIAVADAGAGLPAEVRDNLFEKFYRGKQAKAGGLGLGLSIVHGFMLAQGGDVEADAAPGGGARFTIYLPHALHPSVPIE